MNNLMGGRDREIDEYRKIATTTYEPIQIKESKPKPKPKPESQSNRKLDEWMIYE
jgi:hypothetical protein